MILVGGGTEKVEIEKVHEEDVLNGAPGLKSDSSNICYCQPENHIFHLLLNCQWMETKMSQITQFQPLSREGGVGGCKLQSLIVSPEGFSTNGMESSQICSLLRSNSKQIMR